MTLAKNLANLHNLSDAHLSSWHTVLAQQAKDPDPLDLRGTDITMEQALGAQAWAKSFIGRLEAEMIRRWKASVELRN